MHGTYEFNMYMKIKKHRPIAQVKHFIHLPLQQYWDSHEDQD